MTRSFKSLLFFMGRIAISAGLVYTYIAEPGIGWATNLATGLFVGRMALLGLAFLMTFVMVFIIDNKAQQKTITHTKKELADYTGLRDGVARRSFGEFLGYVDGVLVVGVLAALGWFWTMAIWLLFFEIALRLFIVDIRKNTKIIDRKLQEQEEKDASDS